MRAAAVVRACNDPRILTRGEEGTLNIFGGILYAIFQKVKQLCFFGDFYMQFSKK
jgi:hypothetical protein